jgi:hypothetical protein
MAMLLFTEDISVIKGIYEELEKTMKQDEKEKCPRCGSGREKLDKGACKGIIENEDGTTQMCFLRW